MASSLGAQTGTVTVRIEGLHPATGRVLLNLFRTSDGFPSETTKALSTHTVQVRNQVVMLTLNNLPYGTYAIGFLHDADNDGELDTNFWGIPTEGYGASNNARGAMGPPKWEDAKFTLNAPRHEIRMEVQ